MKKVALILALIALAGCNEKKAPEIGDINNIVIEGKHYTAKQYLDSFCGFPKAEEDKNCFLATQQANKELSKYKKVEW